MAHIAVQLERTPAGLHPASAVALCWARDIGSARGASVTAVCEGDAGESDSPLVEAAARFGADAIVFGGPSGLRNLCERLRPVHVLVAHTPQGIAAARALDAGEATVRWLRERTPAFATADALTAVVAGTIPWHHFELELDPEYEGDVDRAELPAFASPERGPRPVFDLGPRPLGYIGPADLDPVVASALRDLGATPTTLADAPHHGVGTTLILAAPETPQPDELGRSEEGRLIVLTGPHRPSVEAVPAAWQHADWVLPGLWGNVIARLQEGPWTGPTS